MREMRVPMHFVALAVGLGIRGRQPGGAVLGATDINTTATEQASLTPAEIHPVPDIPQVLELACADQRFVALALDNFTAAAVQLGGAFATIAKVPATRFALVSEMQKKPPAKSPIALLQQRAPVLYFLQVDVLAGRSKECPCPCIPGTPALQVAQELQAALNAGPVGGFAFTARFGGRWSGNQTFPKPAPPPADARVAPFYDAGATAQSQTTMQAWAFSNATKSVVDDFENELHASMDRAANALSNSGSEIPCTRTSPDGLASPCLYPGKIAAEIPIDQTGYPNPIPMT